MLKGSTLETVAMRTGGRQADGAGTTAEDPAASPADGSDRPDAPKDGSGDGAGNGSGGGSTL